MSRVPPIEGLLRRFSSNRFIAVVAERLVLGRADVAVTLLERAYAPVINRFGLDICLVDNQPHPAAVVEVHAVLFRTVLVE